MTNGECALPLHLLPERPASGRILAPNGATTDNSDRADTPRAVTVDVGRSGDCHSNVTVVSLFLLPSPQYLGYKGNRAPHIGLPRTARSEEGPSCHSVRPMPRI